MNQVNLIGNLTRDPELRYTPGGTAIAKLGIAINRKYKDKNGQTVEDTTFVDVDTFGKTAELAGQYLTKGRMIRITGRLKLDTWEDKQTGKNRSRLGVVGEELQFIGGGRNTEAAARPTTNSDHSTRYGHGGTESNNPPMDDDVPF